MDDTAVDVVVVGGGVAGLTAAATAASAGRTVALVAANPAANRAGTDEVGRFRFNRGAHALYRRSAGRPVLRRLGVRVEGRRPPLIGSMGRRGDVVDRLPLGPVSAARTELVTGRESARLVRVLAGMPRWRPAELADRTAAAWFDDLGLDGGARQVVEMLARTATYAADLDLVSADLVAGQMRSALVGGVDYLHGGWTTLLDGLAGAGVRRGVRRLDAVAGPITPEGERVRVRVSARPTPGGGDTDGAIPEGAIPEGAIPEGATTLLARSVVVAAGTPDACARLLPGTTAPWPDLGPASRVACLDLGLAAVPSTGALFGLDRPLYLVRHAPPADLAPRGAAVVHLMRYLHAGSTPPPADLRADMAAHARAGGIDPDGAEEARYLHRMVACGALPVPSAGGMAGRPDVTATGLARVYVAGDWVGPVGHLVDAALVSGEEAGRRAASRAASGAAGPTSAAWATGPVAAGAAAAGSVA